MIINASKFGVCFYYGKVQNLRTDICHMGHGSKAMGLIYALALYYD
jgi:hypothetical protein